MPTDALSCQPSNQMVDAYAADHFRDWGHQLVDILADHLQQSHQGKLANVLPAVTPDAQLADWPGDFGHPDPAGTMMLLQKVIHRSNHLQHPHYVGHQVAVPLPLAGLCDLIDGLLNNASAIYEMGPVSTVMERRVIEWMTRCVGYEQSSGGVLTSGGTLANLTGMLMARHIKEQAFRAEHPGQPLPRFAVLTSSQSHYSVSRAVQVIGLGSDGVIPIPVDNRFKFSRTDLEAAYQRAIDQGFTVIAAVGSACSTATGTYEPLAMMAEFCQANDLWFHVDGAHGASALLSQKYRHLLEGIEQADSLIWDAHKMMMMPGLVTAVLFKNGQHAYETFNPQSAYLFQNKTDEEWYNPGRRTFECTKKMLGLKMYVTLSAYGEQLFAQHVTYAYDLARAFAERLKAAPDFELAVEPESNIVCFRYVPEPLAAPEFESELSMLQDRIREQIVNSGSFYLVHTQLPAGLFLRCTLINPLTTLEHLEHLLTEIRTVAKTLMQ